MTKVFCIGFNKTGTASLHAFFQRVGLSSSHDPTYQARTRTMPEDELRRYLDAHDAFSDGERADFVRLLRLYPDARFVLNTRGLRGWLGSRVKHVFRRDGAALEHPPAAFAADVDPARPESSGPRPGTWSGPMAREYLHDPERAISDWIDRREFHHRAVIRHFASSGAPRSLLKLNVIQDRAWATALATFLGLPIPAPDAAGIHVNEASAQESWPGMAGRLRQIEHVLVQKNIQPEEWDNDMYVGFEIEQTGLSR